MASISTAELRILITAQDYASAQLARTVSGMGSLAQKATQTGAQMTRALTLPAGLIGGTIIKEAADFERTLNVLVNTTRNAGDNVVDAADGFGDATKRMAAFREEALRLGADTQIANISASDAATAMDELAKAGLSVNNTLAAARGTVLLAAAGNMDVTQAADLATAALKQFGLQGREMENVTNMMARATEVSRIKFADMAVGLRQGGAAMATLGVPLEGFLAILGTLVDRGVSGGVAATSLRRAISAVASPTAKASAAMEKYNIELFDAKGTFVGFPQLIDNLNESLGDLPMKEKFAAIKDIFGQEGFKSIAPLLMAAKDGSEALQELTDQFEHGEINADQYKEALDKLAQSGLKFSDQLRNTEKDIKGSNAAELINIARMKGLAGALEALKSSWETFAVVIGTPFLTRLAKIAVGFADLTTGLGKWMDQNPRVLEFVATFGAVVAVIGPAIFFFGRLLTLIGALFTPLGLATVALAAFAGAWDIDYQGIQQRTNNMFDSLREGIRQAGEDFHNWGVASGDTEATIGESLSGIGGLVLAFQFAMQQNWPAAQKAWDEAMASFGRALEHGKVVAGNFVSEILNIVGELVGIDVSEITGWADKLGALFGVDVTGIAGTWNQLIAIAQTVMNRVLAIFGQGLDTVAGMLGIDTTTIEGNWNKIVAIAQGVVDRVKAIFTGALDTALGFLGIDPDTIGSNWQKLVKIAQEVWAGVNTAFSKALDVGAGLFGLDITATTGTWDKLKEITASAATQIEGASERIGKAMAKIAEFEPPPVKGPTWIEKLTESAPMLVPALRGAEAAIKNVAEAFTILLDILGDLHIFSALGTGLALITLSLAAVTFAIVTAMDAFRTLWSIMSAGIDIVVQAAQGYLRLGIAMAKLATGDTAGAAEQISMAVEDFKISDAAKNKVGEEIQGFMDRIKQRLTSNAKSTTADVVTELFGDMPEEIHKKADEVSKAVEEIPVAIDAQVAPAEAAGKAVGTGATAGLSDGLAGLPPTAEGMMQDVKDTFTSAEAEVLSLGPRIAQGASEVFGTMKEDVEGQLGPLQESVSAAMTDIGTSITTGWNNIGPNTVAALETLNTTVQSTFETANNTVQSTFDQIVTTVSTKGGELLASWGETWSKTLTIMGEPLAQMGEQISQAWTKIQTDTSATLATINTTVQTGFATMQATVTQAGTEMQTQMSTTWTTIQTNAQTAWTAIDTTVQTSFATIVATVTTGGQTILTTMTTTWETIRTAAATAWTAITTAITTEINSEIAIITGGGQRMIAEMQAAAAGMTSAMTTGLATLVSVVQSSIASAIAAVTGQIGAASAAGASIGNAIATGLSSAVTAGAGRAAAAAAALVTSAIGAARAAADANSPSRKMAALGTDMIDGLANAISNGQSRVADAVKIIIKEAMDANIDPMVALALAKAESAFNARAVGDSGHSVGLFQLHDAGQGAGMSRASREDPTTNARKFLQSHKELFQQMKAEIKDTTELVRQFGVAAEAPLDKSGAAYAAAYQQLQEQIQAAGGAVAEMANSEDGFNAALGESVDTAASLEPLLERQLALKEEMALIDVKMLGGKQNLERIERQIGLVEAGTREERLAALQGNRQDNALLQQELQLKLMLAKAEAGAPKDAKGKTGGTQEIADIKAALELLGQQREEISLTAQLTKAENAARAMGLREQALLQQEALRPLEDQQFLVGQQVAQIDALNTAWQAAQSTIQSANTTENAARREVIATMREQAGANVDILSTGQAALQEMLASGRITQQEFTRYTAILQSFGQAASQSTQGAVTGIQAIGEASANAGQDVSQTGQALVIAGTQIQQVGQAGAQASQILSTTAAQGFATFAEQASVAAQAAVTNVINVLNGAAPGAYNAGYNLGVNVGQGLTNGVIESGNQAIEAAIAVANAVIEAMRGPEGFDAQSPARKSYFIGQDVMDGLILGLQNPTVSDVVKQRIQQYIQMAEQYRKLIPEAIDNELRIIETRTNQAKALLGILDLEFRMKDAQRAAEDAQRGSVKDQLRLLAIDKERNELRLKELDHLRAVQAATDAVEATERAIQEIEEGTLAERLHLLEVDLQQNLLKREQLMLQREIAEASAVVEETERAIKAIERGSLDDQYRALELDHERAIIRQAELAMTDELLAARWEVEDTEKRIQDIERGTLAERQRELALDQQKNILSKERIEIERRLRQIHEAGLNKDINAFYGQGLQVVDPNDPLQQEVNQLHNRLALIDDQNELLEDEGEIRRLNGQIASYEYRLQLLTQQDMLDALEAEQTALERQNELLQLESDIRSNNVELATYALQVQLVAQQAILDALNDQDEALQAQIDLLEFEAELRQINADISKYALLVQLETQQEVLKALEEQSRAFERQNQSLDEEAERIRILNELRAYGALAQAIVLEEEHRQQQRIIDDLDRQYEALNRQKQVYDAILRAVDYLHDHLIDEGIIPDPFAQEPHEPVGPGEDGKTRPGGSAGGAGARAGGAIARAGEGISKAMTQAKVDTEAFTGNAAAALARLKPVVTDTSTSFDGVTTATEVMAVETVAAIDGMGVEIAASAEVMSTGYKASVTNMGEAIITTTKDMAGNVITTTTDMSGQVISQYATLANGASLNTVTMADTVMTTTTAMGDGVITTMRDLSGNVITTTTDLAGNVISQYVTLADGVVAAATTETIGVGVQTTTMATETLATVGQMAVDMGLTTTTMATDTIATAEQLAADMGTTTTTMATDTIATVEQMAADMATTTEQMSSDTIDTVEQMANEMGNTTEQMASDTIDTVEQMGSDAVSATEEMGADVVTATEQMATDTVTAVEQMGADVVSQMDTMGSAAGGSTEAMAGAVAQAAQTMESDVVSTVESMVSDTEGNFEQLEGAADTAAQSLEAIGDVNIPAPDVGDVIEAMEEIKEAAEEAAEAVEDAGDSGGGNGDDGDHDATGGVVTPGKMYTVGEFGRELFVPWTKGFIMPHNLTEQILDANRARQAMRDYQPVQFVGAGAGSGGSTENNTTVNNFNVQYTAMNQKKTGESDVQQVLKDMITMLSIGGS